MWNGFIWLRLRLLWTSNNHTAYIKDDEFLDQPSNYKLLNNFLHVLQKYTQKCEMCWSDLEFEAISSFGANYSFRVLETRTLLCQSKIK